MTAPTVTDLHTDITPFVVTDGIPVLVGDNLYISGTNLASVTAITVGGVTAVVGAWDGTELATVVPAGTTSGDVIVTNPDGASPPNPPFSSVVICSPGPYIPHANLWIHVRTEAVGGLGVGRDRHAFLLPLSSFDPDLATAWANSGFGGPQDFENAHPAFGASVGTEYNDGFDPPRWFADEAFFSGDISGALGSALDGSLLPTPPDGALTVRYENDDGALTEIVGPFRVTIEILDASRAGAAYRVVRLTGSYTDGATSSDSDDTFQVDWQAPGSYPAAVYELTTITDMVGPGSHANVTFDDTGLDTGHRFTYAVLPESTDGSGLVDGSDVIQVKPVAGYLYMSAPRFRWLFAAPPIPPPQRQFPRDDGLGISTRRSWPPNISQQYGLRRGTINTYQ